jgi:hypothetical protein
MKDYAIVEQTWTLVTLGRRPYWAAETLEYVLRITRPHLIGRYSEAEIAMLVEGSRITVAEELGLPPWDC